MTSVLLATDSDTLFNEVDGALSSEEINVFRVHAGADVLPAIDHLNPDLVLLDLQIGNMGGVAACLAIRQEESFDRLAHRPVALLLDRSADVFLADSAGAEGWLVKPLDFLRLRRLATTLLAGDTIFEGISANA